MSGRAKTADRAKAMAEGVREVPCPECGKPTRVVKRIKSRELGLSGGMYLSCTACDFSQKK
ncbi:MAG: hypothetical protein HY313_12065 [Acidobacteria bacterium]|nr:hypothetical protein [Acidobacteriota bacterium]